MELMDWIFLTVLVVSIAITLWILLRLVDKVARFIIALFKN